MRHKKHAPAGQTVQGAILNTNVSYHTAPRLSMAAQILMIIEQTPDHANRLRHAYYDRLDHVLRLHYAETRCRV